MKRLYPILFSVLYFACDTPVNKEKVPVIAANDSLASASPSPVSDKKPSRFPPDSTFGYMLHDGSFHGDEIEPGDSSLQYVGLFKGSSDYYFAPAKVKITQVQDAIVDEDDQLTGWGVSASPDTDSSIFYIANMAQLNGHRFVPLTLSTSEILPGERLALKLGDKEYVLYATGRREKEGVYDYKLYLSTTHAGQKVEELLADIPRFDDAMVRVLLAGDIDGDGELDLFLDTSWHYNLAAPTLFLSKPAVGEGKLLKVVARFNSVGC